MWFANPARFMALSRPLAPALGLAAALSLGVGAWLGLRVPPDYQQGETVRIMFVHVPAVFAGMAAYLALAGCSFFGLVFRHALADAAARAAAPLGAAFTLLGLVTGSIWGRPEWGTWWVWDARLTSFLILFLIYLAYLALQAAFEDETQAARMSAILALVGLVMLPIIHFSVEWWHSLHQGEMLLAKGGPKLPPIYLAPLGLMTLGYLLSFGALWLVAVRAEVWRRRALAAEAAA